MKWKTLIILGVVLAVLAVAASLPFWRGGLEKAVGTADGPETKPPIDLTGFSPTEAERIEISGNGQALIFDRQGETWILGEEPTSPEAIGFLFTALESTAVGELVARNPDNHPSLRVTADTGFYLHIEQGSRVLDLLLGPSESLPEGLYLREEGSDNVYAATGNLLQMAAQPEIAWRPATESEDGGEMGIDEEDLDTF